LVIRRFENNYAQSELIQIVFELETLIHRQKNVEALLGLRDKNVVTLSGPA
jgi:hypothetical protein